MSIQLLDPVGEVAKTAPVKSKQLQKVRGLKVGYIFNHHPAAEVIWQHLEGRIDEFYRPAGKARIDKTNVSVPAPLAEVKKLLNEVDYFLVGVGACGSCTAAAVHDGYVLSKLGRPVVVIVQSVFEKAARVQAKILGAPDLFICSYISPTSPETKSDEIWELSTDLAHRAIGMIFPLAESTNESAAELIG
jgi:hypothetical protein